MFLVGRLVFEKPDIENLRGVIRKEVLLELVNSPLDRFLSVLLHHGFWFITHNDERRLSNDRELRGRQSLLQVTDVPGKFSFGKFPGAGRRYSVRTFRCIVIRLNGSLSRCLDIHFPRTAAAS